MSINGPSKIINSGLVLSLDAANQKSYRGTGTDWVDMTKSGVTGSLINGPTFDTSNGGSIFFDGTNDYANVGLKFFNTQKFSMDMWMNVTSFASTGLYVAAAVSNGQYSIFGPTNSYQGYSNTFSAAIQIDAANNAIGTVSQSGYLTNTWYHYSSVYDGSQTGNANRLKLYINGEQKTLIFDATVPSTAYNTNLNMLLAYQISTTGYKWFNGKIAKLNLYNRVLSSDEIIKNYSKDKSKFGW